ncbi:hypothetical protein ACH5RR_024471 [Cinchona calisaya]|uniref:Uncharacterized protein n=1 Tax=Cinchona calisaya TaxID=153742 RepID=A0ABD2YWS1_9GENT
MVQLWQKAIVRGILSTCDMGYDPKFLQGFSEPSCVSSMANISCSIESEPRTLRQVQISQAREVAVDIIQNKESNEATNIFVDGLKPVASIKEMVLVVQEIETLTIADEAAKENKVTKTCCQCPCTSATMIYDSPDELKEPVSAPF